MKILGIAGIIFTVISFCLWLITWVFYFFVAGASGYSQPLHSIMQGASAVAQATQYLAMLLIAIGLIVGASKLKALKG